MTWFYLSFVDPTRPEGQMFVGACLVQAQGEADALRVSRARGCNPGGEVAVVFVEPERGDPPLDAQHVLMTTREEIERRLAPWLGTEGARTETPAEAEADGRTANATYICSPCNEGS